MYGKYTNKSAPKPPRCVNCARPMQLLRRTSRSGGLPDLYSFYCVTCDEWHVEEGDAADQLPHRRGKFGSLEDARGRRSSRAEPEVERSGYQSNRRQSAGGHDRRYFMSPTIAECLEHARQCEWYAAHTSDGEDRRFLLRRAQHWTKLAREKELEIRAFARAAA